MGRKRRIHFPTALYHVIVRGNARQDVFHSDEDRCHFLLLLQEATERFHVRVHSFCLMSNHIHLALQVGNIALSVFMQSISSRYTKWVNKNNDRIGHLFHGRYKAVLVDTDSYLLQLIAYIHLNPVRAGISDVAEDYVWSSHRAYLGIDAIPWLSSDQVLSQFGQPPNQALKFAAFVSGRELEGHRDDFHGMKDDRRILGSEDFVGKALRNENGCMLRKPSIDVVIAAVCEVFEITESALASAGQGRNISEARAIAAWMVREISGDKLSALGKKIGRDTSSLSSACKRLGERTKNEPEMAARMELVRQTVFKFASLQS